MNDDGFGFFLGLLTGLLTATFIFSLVASMTDDSWRKQIVEHGCAGFYLDGNGDRQWAWKSK